jgi:hypothetical protein
MPRPNPIPYLFQAARLGPQIEQPAQDGLCERGVLLEEQPHAVGQLQFVQPQAFDLVQRKQHLEQELLVVRLERQRKPVDDAANTTNRTGNKGPMVIKRNQRNISR